MKYFHNAVLFIWQKPNCIHPCSPQGSGTVLSVNLCATASTNHRRTWRAKSSCLSSRARCTSWDESQSSPSTTRSWSGKPGQRKSAFWRELLAPPGAVQPFHIFTTQFAQVLFDLLINTKPARSHKDIREASSSVPGGQSATPALLPLHPCGLLSVVTVGLFRMLTPDAPWAGSALTKVKTRPYATPSPLQSHTRSSCTLESQS